MNKTHRIPIEAPAGHDPERDVARRTRWGIAPRLVVLALAPIALMVVGMWFVVWRLADHERAAQRAGISYAARSIAAAVDAEISKYMALAQHLSQSPELMQDDIGAFESEVRRIFAPGEDKWILVTDLDGQQILNTAMERGRPLGRRSAKGLAEQQRAFEARSMIVSDVLKGAVTQKWIANIEIPIFRDGSPFRELAVTMELNAFLNLLNAQNLPRNWIAAIIDRSGRLIARVPDNGRGVGEMASESWRHTRGHDGVFELVSLEGVAVVHANAVSAHGWTIGVAIKTAEMNAAAWGATRSAIYIGVGLSLFSIILAALIARGISRPIAGLRHNAEALMNGADVSFQPSLPEVASVWRALRRSSRERARSEEALRQIAKRFEDAYERAPAGINIVGPDGLIRHCNPAFYKMLGYSDGELVGSDFLPIVFPDDRERELRIAEALRRDPHIPIEIESRYLHKNGNAVWVQKVVSTFAAKDGEPPDILAIAIDISARRRAEADLRESEERLRLFVDRAPAAIAMFDTNMRYLAASRRFVQDYGVPARDGYELTGRNHYEVFTDMPEKWREVHRRVLAGQTLSVDEERFDRADGSVDWVRWEMAPWRKADGSIGGAVLFSEVVTERKRAQEALRESEARLRFALEAADAGSWEAVPAIEYFEASDRAANLLGLRLGEPISSENLLSSVHPEDKRSVREAVARTIETGERFIAEFRVARPDGSIRWIETRAEWRSDSEPRKIAGLIFDVTERKRASEQVQLLLKEVNHRSKNLLTLVLGIARQTLKLHPDDFLSTFSNRVGALAANQDILVQHEWQDVELGALMRSQLAPFEDAIAARLKAHGPTIYVTASAAQTIGMAVHELATNALKHGSLMSADGQVDIEWQVERETFRMTWRESGGEPVVAPKKSGFGTTVIRDVIRSSLGAVVNLDYAQSGFCWRVECPVGRILGKERAGDTPETFPVGPPPGPARGLRVLVVEDEPLVAMEIRQMLEEAGFAVLGPCARVAAALGLLRENGCDAAVLDINLGDETSEAAADELRRRGVPFLSVSGYSQAQRPSAFEGSPALAKPISAEQLIAAVMRIMKASAQSSKHAHTTIH